MMAPLSHAAVPFFFFNDTATTEIYTLSLHDALPISFSWCGKIRSCPPPWMSNVRSEEHTSELQSHSDLVCRLLLEKKNRRSCAVLSRRPAKSGTCRRESDPVPHPVRLPAAEGGEAED